MDHIELTDEKIDALRSHRIAVATAAAESSEDGEVYQLDDLSFQMWERTAAFFSEIIDNQMKANELPGLKPISPDKFGKMAVVAFEEDLAKKAAKDSPKYAFLSLCGAIVAQNGLAAARLKRKRKKQEQETAEDEV